MFLSEAGTERSGIVCWLTRAAYSLFLVLLGCQEWYKSSVLLLGSPLSLLGVGF